MFPALSHSCTAGRDIDLRAEGPRAYVARERRGLGLVLMVRVLLLGLVLQYLHEHRSGGFLRLLFCYRDVVVGANPPERTILYCYMHSHCVKKRAVEIRFIDRPDVIEQYRLRH